MFNVSDEKAGRIMEAIRQERVNDQQGFYLLGEDSKWNFKVSRNQLILVSAPTGVGKTGFLLDCAKERIREKRKCLLIANEETKGLIYKRLLDAYLRANAGAEEGITEEAVLKEVLAYLEVVDALDDIGVYAYDRIVEVTYKLIKELQPEIVFIDQISYCKEKHDKSQDHIPVHDALPKIPEAFMKLRTTCGESLPPIVMTQQGQSTSTGGASEEGLRGSKTTPQSVDKHIALVKKANDEVEFQVRKYRGSRKPPNAIFVYDSASETFERVDDFDEEDVVTAAAQADENVLHDAEALS